MNRTPSCFVSIFAEKIERPENICLIPADCRCWAIIHFGCWCCFTIYMALKQLLPPLLSGFFEDGQFLRLMAPLPPLAPDENELACYWIVLKVLSTTHRRPRLRRNRILLLWHVYDVSRISTTTFGARRTRAGARLSTYVIPTLHCGFAHYRVLTHKWKF